MGLDMYLQAKRFISKHNAGDQEIIKKLKEIFPRLSTKANIDQIRLDAGYWRKANAIHKWFVDNVQEGEDNCATYYVPLSKLKELREICIEILANKDKAKDLLPTSEGFFFGTYEYDEWYFDSLQETIEIVDKCIELVSIDSNIYFEYGSSW